MWKDSADADKEERQKNICELLRDVIDKFDDLAEFLEHVSLMTADDSRDEATDVVSIMTMHAAKGLEFETVFLPAWEDGIFPNEISIAEDGLEEERRLAYVAITRAKKRCFIFYSMSRMQFGQWQHNPPSRFIGEIDARFLELPVGMQYARPRPALNRRIETMVGKMINMDEFGAGVIIEDKPDHYIVAFKSGIKKIPR
jgi:DNA helicase-2/ATP-dependent DNA helicase PcrA